MSGTPSDATRRDATRRVRPSRSQRLLAAYMHSAESPDLTLLRGGLWKSESSQPSMVSPDQLDTVLEQYKLYVEMADQVSARRATANAFFLSLNTGVFTIVGVFWQYRPWGLAALLVVPWSMLVVQCLAWFWILRSYRQLSIVKYAVIDALEEGLPASPYWGGQSGRLYRGPAGGAAHLMTVAWHRTTMPLMQRMAGHNRPLPDRVIRATSVG